MPEFSVEHLDRLYRVPSLARQRSATIRELSPRIGERVLDLGCGPGFLSAELAREVGPSGKTVALDRNTAMVASTLRRAKEHGVKDRLTAIVADAAEIPLARDSIDAVVAVQVLEHVANSNAALRELRRVLKPTGRALIIDTDWRSCIWNSSDSGRMDLVLRKWQEHFASPRLPEQLPQLLREHHFDVVKVGTVTIVESASQDDSYSAGMVPVIAEFMARTHPELAATWKQDLRELSGSTNAYFSLDRTLIVARASTK